MSGVVKEWRSSPMLLHCGFDWDHVIKPGEWYLAIVYDAAHALIRCHACAKKYFPHDPLPPMPSEPAAEEA